MRNICRRNKKGFTIIELLVVIGILGIVLAVILSEYVRVLQQAAVTRKMVKTEMDVVNVLWPLFKEIESAGFGIPKTSITSSGSACTRANGFLPFAYDAANNRITLHSTAAGDKREAGSWSSIGAVNCKVTGISSGQYVAVINPSAMTELAFTNTTTSGTDVVLAGCDPMWADMTAYVLPNTGSLECAQVFYQMNAYGANRPAVCAPSGGAPNEIVGALVRSVAYDSGADNSQPMVDCIRDFSFRFGCINRATGALTWTSDTAACTSSVGDLRLVKIGIVIQESTRDSAYTSPTTVSLFTDLGALKKDVNIISTQRNYRWRTVERTIALRNLE